MGTKNLKHETNSLMIVQLQKKKKKKSLCKIDKEPNFQWKPHFQYKPPFR